MFLHENKAISIDSLKLIDYYKAIAVIALRTLIFISIPFLITQCSLLLLSLSLVSRLYWTNLFTYFFNESNHMFASIALCLIALVLGICLFVFNMIKHYQNEKITIKFKSYPLKTPIGSDSFKHNLILNQSSFIDRGDRTSICSAFSENESNDALLSASTIHDYFPMK